MRGDGGRGTRGKRLQNASALCCMHGACVPKRVVQHDARERKTVATLKLTFASVFGTPSPPPPPTLQIKVSKVHVENAGGSRVSGAVHLSAREGARATALAAAL
jgi:hypothetical protein